MAWVLAGQTAVTTRIRGLVIAVLVERTRICEVIGLQETGLLRPAKKRCLCDTGYRAGDVGSINLSGPADQIMTDSRAA